MRQDAVRYNITPEVLLLRNGRSFPNVLDGIRVVAMCRCVLNVFVRVFTVWIKYELADPLGVYGQPAQLEDGLEDYLGGLGFAGTRHAKESGLLAKQVRRGHKDGYVRHSLEAPVS